MSSDVDVGVCILALLEGERAELEALLEDAGELSPQLRAVLEMLRHPPAVHRYELAELIRQVESDVAA